MATKLGDAKISVRLDTEGAEDKLDAIEKRTKKDEEKIRKAEKKSKDRERRGKRAGDKVRAKKKGGMRPAVAGGIAGAVVSAIPFGEAFMAAEAVLEFGLPAIFETTKKILDENVPDLPGFTQMKDLILESQQASINALSEGLSYLRAKIEAAEMAKEGAMDVIRTSTGLGVPIDAGFLVDHTINMFKVGEVQSAMRSRIKKIQAANMGESLLKTISGFTH